jgi:hypothetical protein
MSSASKAAILPLDDPGPSSVAVEIGAAGAESNPQPAAYKAAALPLSYDGA